jgi:hypothetical protein
MIFILGNRLPKYTVQRKSVCDFDRRSWNGGKGTGRRATQVFEDKRIYISHTLYMAIYKKLLLSYRYLPLPYDFQLKDKTWALRLGQYMDRWLRIISFARLRNVLVLRFSILNSMTPFPVGMGCV